MTKYFIIGGCSYGHKNPTIIEEIFFDKKSENFTENEHIKTINVDASSASNKFIVESIIIAVNTLLNKGIDSKDILVINNFTQIGRENVLVPNEIENQIKNNIESILNDNKFNREFEIKNNYYIGFAENNNGLYSLLTSPENTNEYVKKWNNIQEKYFFKYKNPILYFEEYLKDIFTLQSYLKKVNVESISFMMSNVFEGWDKNFGHVYTSNKEWKLPSLKNTIHINQLSKITNILWELIDFSKFVFYETKENKYGGLDEFFINEIVDENELCDLGYHPGHFYGRHPSIFVYTEFTKIVMINKILDWKIKSESL